MLRPRQQASRAEVDAAIRAIRAYWQQGRQSLRELPGRGGYGKQSLDAAAGQLDWNETRLRKARKFAARTTGYSKEQLSELFRLLREHRPVFGLSHVGILVTVSWSDGREEWQRKCILHNWSKAKLEMEIRKRFGSRRQGGRWRYVEADKGHLLVQLDEMTDSFQRWVAVTSEKYQEGSQAQCALDALPEAVRNLVATVSRAVRKLREEVTRELEAVRVDLQKKGRA